jgi:hypothetical protein
VVVLKGELGADAEHGAQGGEQAERQGEHGQVAHDAMSVLRSLCIRALTDRGAGLRTRTWRTIVLQHLQVVAAAIPPTQI